MLWAGRTSFVNISDFSMRGSSHLVKNYSSLQFTEKKEKKDFRIFLDIGIPGSLFSNTAPKIF